MSFEGPISADETFPKRSPGIVSAFAGSSLASLTVISLVAVTLMLPELLIGVTVTDSYRFSVIWPQQFGELLSHGHLYPRWLPRSWDGFGSPVFYFYPPLFFWVAGAFGALTSGSLPIERVVPLGSLTMMIVSGVAMRAWLRTHVGNGRALAGAAAYMAAPYHLYDIYARGALAEASAYASVPVVMLALARLGAGRSRYLPVLALGYAALLFSHLPSALLVTLFLVPPCALLVAHGSDRPARFITLALIGGVTGLAVAAAYLLPAVTLLPFASPGDLSQSFYQPEHWFFWRLPGGPMGARMMFIVPVTVAAFLAAAGVAAKSWRQHDDAKFWAGLTAILTILIAGLIPPLWSLPGLHLVQFPWRALLLVEFASITMLAIGMPAIRSLFALGAVTLLAFSYVVLGLMISHTISRTWTGGREASSDIELQYLDAPEYLPVGSGVVQGEGPDHLRITLPRMPLALASNPLAKLRASAASDGALAVWVDTPRSTEIRLRRFYFPHWSLRDGHERQVAFGPDPRDKVVTFVAPAGRSIFRLEPGTAPGERLAEAISLFGLLAVFAFFSISAVPRLRNDGCRPLAAG